MHRASATLVWRRQFAGVQCQPKCAMVRQAEPGADNHERTGRTRTLHFPGGFAHVFLIALNARLARKSISVSIAVMERLWPRHFRKALFAALCTLPVVLGFFVAWKHSVPLPFWDEWNTP